MFRNSNFSNNDATDRGGVISLVGSSLHINETNMYNNTASEGETVSACSSAVSIHDDVSSNVDPNAPTCTLYDIHIDSYDVTLFDQVYTTAPPTTTEEITTTQAPTTTEEITTQAPTTTEEITTQAPTTTEEITTTQAPTTTEEITTQAPTTTKEIATTQAPTTTEEITTTQASTYLAETESSMTSITTDLELSSGMCTIL